VEASGRDVPASIEQVKKKKRLVLYWFVTKKGRHSLLHLLSIHIY
jgi:hypothetical protein